MKISIIIVTHNGSEWIERCLGSIMPILRYHEVIVVDNASTDDTLAKVMWFGDDVVIHPSDKNLGFCKGCNIGAELATGTHLLFLNQDTWIDERCLHALELSSAEIVQPLVCDYESNKYQSIGSCGIDIFGMPTRCGGPKNRTRFSGYGCAMMVEADAFRKLGGFDESFEMYCEETDLCWRAHLLGMSVEACLLAVVHHRDASNHTTSRHKRYLSVRNGLKMILKNTGNWSWMPLSYIALMIVEGLLLSAIRRDMSILRETYWTAILDSLCYTKSERTVSDWAILKRFLRLTPARTEEIFRAMKHGIPKL